MRVGVSPEVAFDYLVEPRNRRAWQSSLAGVEQVTGEPRVGQRWVDVTRAGPRPAMETTELDRPRRWSERGTWRGVEAVLTLEFSTTPAGCEIGYSVLVRGRGVLAPAAWVLGKLAPVAVRSDLTRAARILEAGTGRGAGDHGGRRQ
ncbi:MAG: hypothetical protein JWO11_1497 [Nocardioides sp.]|nr:hypothetical protein [Nocardioides sp.]